MLKNPSAYAKSDDALDRPLAFYPLAFHADLAPLRRLQ